MLNSSRRLPPSLDAAALDPSATAPAAVVDKEKFFLVYALSQASSSGDSARPKLLSVQHLLGSVVDSARTVVKGTESQRKFNTQFIEFCRIALVAMSDLEDTVFELNNPGRKASEALDEEVMGIQERDFVRDLAKYVSSQTSAFTPQYLEHIAMNALSKHLQQQQSRKRDRTASSLDGKKSGAQPKSRKGEAGTAASADGRSPRMSPADNLGLLDEAELMRVAMLINGSGSGGGGGSESAPLLHHSMHHIVPETPGVFTSPKDGKRYDLRSETQKLSAIPELMQRLQPWTIPHLFTGLLVDRVTTEKEKRSATSAMLRNEAAGPTSSPPSLQPNSSSVEDPQATTTTTTTTTVTPVLEVCLAPTPAELLRLWENRDAALSTAAPPAAVKRRRQSPLQSAGGSPLQGVTQQQSPALDGSGGGAFAFFPSLSTAMKMNTEVPTPVMKELVHNGVSHLEFLM